MESSASLPEMPSYKDLRRGQAAACQRFKDGLLTTVAKLPTGYGKTKLAAFSFATLRALDKVDIAVIVVPQIGQAEQMSEDFPRELRALGIQTKSCNIGDNRPLALRMCKSGEALVFILTVQSIVQSRTTVDAVRQITGGKRCFLVIDEYHHYGVDAAWTREVQKIQHVAFLAMSATPDRKGEQPIFGEPHVFLTYKQGVEEGAVKPLSLNSYDYRIDFVSKSGEVTTFTISELIDAAGSAPDEIDRWAAARQARWTAKYVSPLITFPVERLISLYADHGIRSQMIVYALSCSHAQVVCEQVRALIPEGMTVDWVGSGPNGRSEDKNAEILKRFCPAKDITGRRPWSLEILVCVDMAGEGLDICDASEAVFLTSPNIHNTSKQKIGRLSRLIKSDFDVVGKVNVDAASKWAPFRGEKVMAALDLAEGDMDDPEDDADEPGEDKEFDGEFIYEPLPPGPIVKITDVSLIDIQSDPEFLFVKEAVKAKAVVTFDDAEADRIAEEAGLRYKRRAAERFNATILQEDVRRQLNARVRKIAGFASRLLSREGRMFTRDMVGDVAKRINSTKRRVFGGVEALTIEQLEQHNEWLRNLEAALMRGEIPSWM